MATRPPDTLFDAPKGGPIERREPTIGAIPSAAAGAVEIAPRLARAEPEEELEAAAGAGAEISSRIDTVAVILADDPIMREQLAPLLDALATHRTPVHVEGIVDEQWQAIDASPRQSWRELRVGLQLASRAGPVAESEIEGFNQAIARVRRRRRARCRSASRRRPPRSARATWTPSARMRTSRWP